MPVCSLLQNKCDDEEKQLSKEQQTKHDILIHSLTGFTQISTKKKLGGQRTTKGKRQVEEAGCVYTIKKTYESGYMGTHNIIITFCVVCRNNKHNRS